MSVRSVKPTKVTVKYDPFANDLNLPTLFKKTSTGAIQFWRIAVMDHPDHSTGYDIWTEYGQVDGKVQETVDSIFEGKNIGKKNETSPKQQAEAEAKAKWEKQKKKGYVESIEAAKNDKLDDLIEGGILPMLAHKFAEQGHKIKYPAFVQPKLDGIRCIAIVKGGKCTLWSRTRKPITSCPHIIEELERIFPMSDVTLDGELYNHDYKSNFEKIVSLVRQEEPDPEHHIIHYHVYDMVNDSVFEVRTESLKDGLMEYTLSPNSSLRLVPTFLCTVEENVMQFFDEFRKNGYEGAMLRNANSKYVNKRSYDLQKVKEFDDAEFEIIGIDEGRGKLSGHVGAFRCRMENGKEFLAKMSGDTAKLRDYFNDHSKWRGKRLTVQYQGLTSAEGVPRFPVGVTIRDYE